MVLKVDACIAQHQGDRKEQQDCAAIMQHPRRRNIALAVVADGMGGHTGGRLAAEQVLHTTRNSFDRFAPAEESARSLLESSMLEAHTMIKASRFINEKEPHSTAVMLLLQPGKVTWGYCGDSRLYHFRGDRLLRRTVDHSYVEHLVATGKITPQQAELHPQKNALMTALGGQEEPIFNFSETEEVQQGDSFMLCSDGLWAYFGESELARIIHDNSARHACEILISYARTRAKGQGDNISLVVAKLV